jgi:hypothetical protein
MIEVPAVLASLIAINTVYQVVLCINTDYYKAVSPAGIVEHLCKFHKTSPQLRKQVEAFIQTIPWSYDFSSIMLPADGLAPQPVLPVLEGFQCRQCPFCSQSRKSMKVHGNRVHAIKRAGDDQLYQVVRLQTWFRDRKERYWVVNDESQETVQEIGDKSDSPVPQEQEQLGMPQPPGLQCISDTTALYIQRANWPAAFAELQHWRAMQEMTYIPKTLAGASSMLQLQLGKTVLGLATYEYTAETEGVLNYIMQHMPLVWIRCETTFRTTPVAFRTDLASYTESTMCKHAFAWVRNQDTFQCYTGT